MDLYALRKKLAPGEEQQLRIVNLMGYDLDANALMVLSQALMSNSIVEELTLDIPIVTKENAKYLAELLDAHATIRAFRLRKSEFEEGAMAILVANFGNYDKLQTISFSGCEIENIAVELLSQAMIKLPDLTNLVLYENKISHNGSHALGMILSKAPNLRILDLENNYVGAKGFAQVAEGLKYTRSLLLLNLEKNGLDDSALASLINAVKQCSLDKLYVNLQDNQISDIGAKEFAEFLSLNKVITRINFAFNKITGEGLEAIAENLLKNNILRRISFESNLIDDRGALAMAKTLAIHKYIARVNMQGNKLITQDGMQALCGALEQNRSLIFFKFPHSGTAEGQRMFVQIELNVSLSKLHIQFDILKHLYQELIFARIICRRIGLPVYNKRPHHCVSDSGYLLLENREFSSDKHRGLAVLEHRLQNTHRDVLELSAAMPLLAPFLMLRQDQLLQAVTSRFRAV